MTMRELPRRASVRHALAESRCKRCECGAGAGRGYPARMSKSRKAIVFALAVGAAACGTRTGLDADENVASTKERLCTWRVGKPSTITSSTPLCIQQTESAGDVVRVRISHRDATMRGPEVESLWDPGAVVRTFDFGLDGSPAPEPRSAGPFGPVDGYGHIGALGIDLMTRSCLFAPVDALGFSTGAVKAVGTGTCFDLRATSFGFTFIEDKPSSVWNLVRIDTRGNELGRTPLDPLLPGAWHHRVDGVDGSFTVFTDSGSTDERTWATTRVLHFGADGTLVTPAREIDSSSDWTVSDRQAAASLGENILFLRGGNDPANATAPAWTEAYVVDQDGSVRRPRVDLPGERPLRPIVMPWGEVLVINESPESRELGIHFLSTDLTKRREPLHVPRDNGHYVWVESAVAKTGPASAVVMLLQVDDAGSNESLTMTARPIVCD